MVSPTGKEPTITSGKGANKLRVLVVEDEGRLVAMLLRVIGRIGCVPEAAVRCKEALIKAKNRTYDLILLDHYLSDGSGFDLLAQIKKLQPAAEIVTMTGENSKEIELQCRNQRVIYHLIKPFDFNELISLISHAAQRKSEKN